MKTSLILMLSITLVVVLAGSLNAKTVALDPIGDSLIKSADPDSTFPDDESLWPSKIGTAGAAGEYSIAYVQYQLPGDVDELTAAKFRTVQTTKLGSFSYYVYQLKDEVVQPDVNTYTWNNAPGNNPSDLILGTAGRYDPATADYAAYVAVSRLDPVGNEYEDILNATGFSALLADTDGIVTYFFVRRQITTTDGGLAALENTEYHPIQLEITYTPVAQAAIVVDEGDGLLVNELGETSDTYTVALAGAPSENVTVEFDYDQTQVTLMPATLEFTPTDYAAKTVTVSAVDDDLVEGQSTLNITHSAVSNDYNYMFASQVQTSVTISDDDIKTVLITATADSEVKSAEPDTAFPTGDLAPLTGASPSMDLVFSFIRFTLPEDFAYAVDAEFRIVRTALAGNESDIYVACVFDDIEQGDVNTYTWNTAPGVDTSADPNSSPLYDSAQAIIVNTLDVPLTGNVGDEITGLESSNWRLVNQLNIDTDKVITLIMVRAAKANDVDQWASTESVSYHPPQIFLVYSDTRYCGQPGQGYSLGDVNRDCYVNLLDIAEIASEW